MVKQSPKKPTKVYKIAEMRPIHSKILPKNYNEFATYFYIIFIILYGIDFLINKTPNERRIIKILLKNTTKMVRKRIKNNYNCIKTVFKNDENGKKTIKNRRKW
jgi:hypothetical protein